MTVEDNGGFHALTDLSPEEYAGDVEAINQNRRLNLAEAFARAPINPRTDAVILTGSDGKSERHTQSKTEMTILTTTRDGDQGASLATWYRPRFRHNFSERFDVSPTTGLPEVKVVDPDDQPVPLSYAYNDRELIYPDRILNTQFLLGNPEVLQRAKEQVLREATDDSEVGRRIREEIGAQLRIAMKGLNEGVYRRKNLFTLDPPQQYYDEDRGNYSVGFKMAGLRPVQRMTDLLTFRAIRGGKLSITDASHFPTNTVSRLETLSERGLTPDTTAIIPAYQWFLQQYHVAQDRYKSTREEVRIPFEKEVFVDHRSAIHQFRESMKTMKYTT